MSLYKDASLVMIPSAYKDGKLYSIRPTDGSGDFTFSRGSNLAATRVDVNGLIEKGRENLLLQSNQFDTTWSFSNTTSRVGGQAGYDGTNDAWLWTAATGTFARMNQTPTLSGVITGSIYVKAANTHFVAIQPFGANEAYVKFNLSTGAVHETYGDLIDYKIESVGNDWYRCSVTASSSSSQVSIYLLDSAGNFANTNTDSIYIQDAQLEAGLVATDYIETGASTAQAGILEDMPRLDYSASCPALLLEPQRTNFITDSEYFAGLNLYGSISATYGAYTNPSGNDSAYLLEATSAISRIQTLSSTGDGNSAVISIFIKGNDNVSYPTLANQGGGQYTRWEFDANNVLTYYDGDAPSGDYGQEDYGNGWYRIWLKTDTINGSTNYYRFNPDNRYGVGSLYAWGFQVEKNSSYPTSYIPTYGSSVTRSYDDCDLLDLVSKDIITDSTEWTIMFEVDGFSTEYNSPDGQWYAGQNGTLDVYMRPNATNDAYAKFYWRKDGKYIGGTLGKKMIARLGGGTGTTFVDGILDGSSSITGDYSGIGFNKTSNPSAAGYVKQILVFPTALTDSECIALTTI